MEKWTNGSYGTKFLYGDWASESDDTNKWKIFELFRAVGDFLSFLFRRRRISEKLISGEFDVQKYSNLLLKDSVVRPPHVSCGFVPHSQQF